MNVRGKKIYVGLSGGVDSSVSAALLKQAGAIVTGVFIKGWYPPDMPCTWAEERRDAMRVAARLNIPFRTLDASAEYKKSVIDYLISEYGAGRTPNPDVMCNREVKFGAFYRYAMTSGADAIAMGHYRSGEKDQSYFLWAVPKDILNATIFPVGDLEKSEVRKLAKKFNLPIAEKKEIKVSKTLTTLKNAISFTNENWFSKPTDVHEAQYRYRGSRIRGRVEKNCFVVEYPLPETPAPGQSGVFYYRAELIGGGIIEK